MKETVDLYLVLRSELSRYLLRDTFMIFRIGSETVYSCYDCLNFTSWTKYKFSNLTQ